MKENPYAKYVKQPVAQENPYAKYAPKEDSLSSDLAERSSNIKQELAATAMGEKPLVNLPFRLGKQYAGGAYDVVGRAASALTPDFIEEPIKEYAGKAAEYVMGTKPAQAAMRGYETAKEVAPDVMETVEGATMMSGVPPTGALLKKGGASAVTPIAEKMAPVIPEGLADVASLAQKYDIPLSLPQVSESRAVQNVQKVSQELPFSGVENFKDKQLSQWQKQLFKTVGVDADRFTPKTMDFAFKKVGGEFDNLTKGKKFNIQDQFINNVSELTNDAQSLYGKDAASILQKEAMKIIGDFTPDGNIFGELLSRQRSRINKLARRTTDEGNRAALLDLENALIDSIVSDDPRIREALTKAKYHYKNLIAIEPLAQKSKKGFINPTLLNNRVSRIYGREHTTGKSGDIGNLARIGHELLGELGGSDTTQKAIYAGAALGGGYVEPMTTATMLVGNRLMQNKILRNQSLINEAIEKSLKKGNKISGEQLKQLMNLSPEDAISILKESK